MSKDKLDNEMRAALDVLQAILRAHYKDDTITIDWHPDDCEAFVKDERFNMTDQLSNEYLDCKIECALDKLCYSLEWTTGTIFWLYKL